jgi:hypothetical protein
MHVGLRPFGVARGTDCADGLAFLDSRISPHGDRSEMDERDRVAVVGTDRDRQAVSRCRARERDNAGTGREHSLGGLTADVDSAMLSPEVRILAEVERPEHRAGYRPAPGSR